MANRNYVALANQYSQGVLDGSIPVSKITKSTVERQVADLDRAANNDPSFPYVFNDEAANRVCQYLEYNPFIDGGKDVAGKKITLEPWQCFVVTTVWGWLQKLTGFRRFRRAYVECSKGNGKSCLSSPLCNYMTFEDGEPGSQVYSAATTRDQAKIIFDISCKMLRHPLMTKYRAKAGIDFVGGEVSPTAAYQLRSNSNYKPLSSDADSLEGIKPHFIAIDELHAHAKRDLYDNLDTANGKMKGSLLWVVTTAGTNRGSVCYEQHMFIRDIIEGRATDETTFGIIYTIDADDSPWDETTWRKANPNWGVSVDPEEIKAKAAKAKQLPSAQNAFLTKHLDVWCNATTAGLPMADWDACADTTLKIEDFADDECIPGIDLASRLDLVTVAKIFRRTIEGKHHFYGFQTSWLPQEAIDNSPTASLKGWVVEGCLEAVPGKTVDVATVIPEHLEEFASKYIVKEIALDPHKSELVVPGLVKVFGELNEKGNEDGNDKLVTVSPKGAEMCPAMKELETLLIERRFHHNGDPLYTWAIGNVGGYVSQRDSSVFPVKKNAHAKIDPAIATMIALRRWTAYNEESQEHYSLSVVTL